MWYINNFPLGDMWEDKQHIHREPFLCKWSDRAAVVTLTLSRLNGCMLHVFVTWWCVVECVCVFQIILFHYAKFPLKKKEPNQNESLILSLCNAFSWRKWRFVQQLNSIVSVTFLGFFVVFFFFTLEVIWTIFLLWFCSLVNLVSGAWNVDSIQALRSRWVWGREPRVLLALW